MPFNCHIVSWLPHLKYTLEHLATPFSIDLDAERTDNYTGQSASISIPDHPVLKYLNVKFSDNNGKFEVTCPWLDEHTSQTDSDGTVIFTKEDYRVGFKCWHGHCEHRTGDDVYQKLKDDHSSFETEYRTWRNDKIFPRSYDYQTNNQTINDNSSDKPDNNNTSDVADPIADDILHVIDEGFEQLLDTIPLIKLVNLDVMRMAWQRSYETKTNNKINILKSNGTYHSQARAGAYSNIIAAFGHFIMRKEAKEYFLNETESTAKAEKKVAEYQKQITHLFFTYLTNHRQIEDIKYEVDMFTECSRLEIDLNTVSIISSFVPLVPPSDQHKDKIAAVVEDYLQHFPSFIEYLRFVAAARFAPDRRHAGVWIHSGTGWGKSFLMGLFKTLGVIAKVNEQQIKACLSGSPVGLTPGHFTNAWILEFDEFKTVNADMKSINNTLPMAPKNMLMSEVPVYNKTFLSAEIVQSLVGEYGVEAQFSERIAYMKMGNNKLNERPLFNDDRQVYFDALCAFVADYFNDHVKQMRTIGKHAAGKKATKTIEAFHGINHIDKEFEALDTGVIDLANDFHDMIMLFADPITPLNESQVTLKKAMKPSFTIGYTGEGNAVAVLMRPYKVLENYINSEVTKNQQRSMQLKRQTILDHIDPKWKSPRQITGVKNVKGGKKLIKGAMIKINTAENFNDIYIN
jgi:hemerythrin